MVAHDIGAQTAYSDAAAHPHNIRRLVIIDFLIPGFELSGYGGAIWWFGFHQTPDIQEMLTVGKEKEHLSWFYRGLAYNPQAIAEEDIEKFVSHYSAPGGMRAGFEYYRAFPIDAEQNKVSRARAELQMPALVLGDDIYPAIGGDYPGNPTLNSAQQLASNVQGIVVPLSGHWIPEEQPDFRY